MSGIGGSEFILLCLIGLLILGPERLPRVARQLGSWVGKARQMTRTLQRQLEEETSIRKNFGVDPKDLDPNELLKPRDDDSYSPLHDDEDEIDDATVVVKPRDDGGFTPLHGAQDETDDATVVVKPPADADK